MTSSLANIVQTVTSDELYNVLHAATTQDPVLVIASSEKLKTLLTMIGTLDGLSAIATQKSLPVQIRQQSAIQLKNAIQHSWRSRKLLSDQHRLNIRSRSLSLLDEEDDIIAQCNSVIIGKIARMDYPTNWPTLINDLIAFVTSSYKTWTISNGIDTMSGLTLRRSLEILNGVLKEMVTMKMITGVKTMSQVAEQVSVVLQDQFRNLSNNVLNYLNLETIALPQANVSIRLSRLSYKCLVKVSSWVWQRIDVSDFEHFKPWIEEVFQLSINQLHLLYDLRMNLVIARTAPVNSAVIVSFELLTRHIHLFGKFFRKLQQLSASKFVSLPTCNDLILFYWDKVTQATSGPPEYIEDEPKAIFPVRFLVQGMVLFKDSLSQWSSIRKGAKHGTVLSQSFVEQAARILITRLIPLKNKDFESWTSDPEEWVNIEEKDDEQWEFEIRSCGERVLLTLCNQYPEFVTPLLATSFKDINVRPATDFESIIQKETTYCAIGRCASRLKEVIPFNEWLQEIAVLEVQSSDANYAILKRRIAWVIGKWVSEESVSPLNPTIWQILTHLLSSHGPGTDAVVRFTAAIALRRSVDTRNFDVKIVEPYLQSLIMELLQLVAEADTLEMKRKVMQSLNVVIEQSANFIVPYISSIAESIPHLWNISENEYLFKSAILETVTKALEATKDPSGPLRFVVVPLIRDSLSDISRIHLDADALILWQAALRNGSTLHSVDGGPSLAELFPLAIVLLSQNLDLLGDIRLIVESYVLLDSEFILKMHARELLAAFRSALSQAIDTNIKYLLVSLNIVITLAPAELWAEPMHSSGLFSKLIITLLEDKAPTLILTEHILLMARMALSNNIVFPELMSATAAIQNKTESELWEGLLDQWWRRFDNMYEPQHRKLVAMGIASLVATGNPKILERLTSEIFNLWLDVFGEIKEALSTSVNDIGSPLSHLDTYWRDTEEVPDAILEGAEGTLEFDRRKFMYSQDVVSREKLTDFVAARLAEAQMKSGGPESFESLYLRGADLTVVKQIWAELQGSSGKLMTNM